MEIDSDQKIFIIIKLFKEIAFSGVAIPNEIKSISCIGENLYINAYNGSLSEELGFFSFANGWVSILQI